MMLAEYRASIPERVPLGGWHLPLIQPDERELPADFLCRISVARCARVSYLTHDGKRDHERDIELYERLLGGGANGHWSPFEHVATPAADGATRSGETSPAGNSSANAFRRSTPRRFPTRTPLPASNAPRLALFALLLALLVLLVPAAARAEPVSDGRISAIPAQRLLHASVVTLADPVKQRRARAITDDQELIFAGWALAPILAFFVFWQTGYAARVRDVLRRRLRARWAVRGVFGALLGTLATLVSLPFAFAS